MNNFDENVVSRYVKGYSHYKEEKTPHVVKK